MQNSPVFLFPTAEKSTEIEIISRSTRKFHGDLKAFAGEMKSHAEAQRTQRLVVLQTHGLADRFA
ncbi:MAG TPA: hypothetical protein PKE69_25915, partial [Pyrinomonadaceae bacterium]|nr:hypothetical protein [Pyrinomonadaceae bacterium]